MNISDTLAPASDQLDAIELIAGPRTFTVEAVSPGNAEQPVQVQLSGFPRVWRPSKGMRRILAAGWSPEANTWIGKRLTLYYDPAVTFGKDRTGGTRISHMTDLPGNKPLSIPLLVTRGKSAIFTVQPLKDEPTPTRAVTADELIDHAQNAATEDDLNRVARSAVAALQGDELDAVKSIVTARRTELRETLTTGPAE